ncbi:MAG: CvpA family protein [Erysipelotrichaceae bacterium]|nr:CvpA family protein [Erysipelotrichaceae bacterium]
MLIPTSYILYINIALVIFLILALIIGYTKGFLLQLVQALTVIVAGILAWLFSPLLAKTVQIWPADLTPFQNTVLSNLFYEKINVTVCFLLIFFGVILLMLLLHPLIKAIGKIPVIKQLNKLLGMMFSVLIYGIYIMIAIFVLNTPLFLNGGSIVEQSWLNPIKEQVSATFSFIEKPLLESEKLQNLIANRDNLTVDDLNFLTEWLQGENIDDSTIIEFFQQIGK